MDLAKQTPPKQPLPPPRTRVLVAEDHREMRELLVAVLSTDHEVIAARNGEDLLMQLRYATEPVHVVVTDQRMPGLDGLTALRYLRHAGVDAPVVLITAFGDAATHAAARALGAAAVFDKPFSIVDLRTRVRALARGR